MYHDDDDVPVVYPARFTRRHEDHPDAPHGPTSVLYGLALLPFAIPLLWLLAPTLTGKEAVFTHAVPLAIAVGTAGLCLGVVLAADWSFATRLKGIFALVFVAFATAAFLYFLEPTWVEELRRVAGGGTDHNWQLFRPDDGAYEAKLPGPPRPDPAEVVAGWSLRVFRYADRRRHSDTFILAHGPAPAAVADLSDDRFFDAAKQGAEAAANGTLVSEKAVTHQRHPGREFVFTLADRATTRTVRVVRVGKRAFVAAAEGAFLPPDAAEVRRLFDHFSPNEKP